MTSLFYSPPSFSTLPIQVVNAISIFGNDKIVFLQSKGCMPTANWPLQSFSYFYLVLVLLLVNIVNLVHMCLRTNIRGGRQLSMFMSEPCRDSLTHYKISICNNYPSLTYLGQGKN